MCGKRNLVVPGSFSEEDRQRFLECLKNQQPGYVQPLEPVEAVASPPFPPRARLVLMAALAGAVGGFLTTFTLGFFQ